MGRGCKRVLVLACGCVGVRMPVRVRVQMAGGSGNTYACASVRVMEGGLAMGRTKVLVWCAGMGVRARVHVRVCRCAQARARVRWGTKARVRVPLRHPQRMPAVLMHVNDSARGRAHPRAPCAYASRCAPLRATVHVRVRGVCAHVRAKRWVCAFVWRAYGAGASAMVR
jgi:hypothetical protein